jgi:hypothetical protein
MELTQRQRAMLHEAFAALDEDGKGTLGPLELSIAMSSLGYTQGAVDAAIGRGDTNQHGEINFNEFVELVARTEFVRVDDGSSIGSNDAFPLTLVAKTRAISHLVDSYDTRHLDAILRRNGLLLPDIQAGKSSRTLNPSQRMSSRNSLSQPPYASQLRQGALALL